MQKRIHQKVIDGIRNVTPLYIRQRIGPILAEIYYVDRIYIRPNQKKPKILSIRETIKNINEKNLSVIRFGDGEIFMLDGGSLMFQKWSSPLGEALANIFKIKNPKLLICIPGMWDDLKKFEPYARKFIKHHMYRHKHIWDSILSYSYEYGETNFTRNYLAYADKSQSNEIFREIKNLWKGKKVLLVEGEKSRIGVGNDLFKNVSTLKRILCPAENAYERHTEIINEVKKQGRDNLVLVSLGPAAKIIAYELFLMGYRVIDIGHIDMEYEMYLRKSSKQIAVRYKYFNEIHERNPEDCNDEVYVSEIIKKII